MDRVILLTANYRGRPLDIVRALVPEGFTLLSMETASHEELVERAVAADYIIASGNLKIDAEVLDAASRLKMVQRLGVGLDSIDFSALGERIPVYANAGVNAASVAEHTLMFILASLRKLTLIHANTKNGIWKKQEQGVTTRELSAQTVGIIGMGHIGQRVAALLKPFGCRVLYHSLDRLESEEEAALGLEYETFDGVLSRSDIITLHCPLTDATRGIIRKENIARMKPGVIIINTSRGKLVREEDLLRALDTGAVGFAGLDVYEEEPLKNLALVQHEHVVCTPHIAGNTYDSFVQMMKLAFRNIQMYDQGLQAEIEKYQIGEGKL